MGRTNKLVEYATCLGDSAFENGKTKYFDSDHEAKGILEFYRDDYPYFEGQAPFDHTYTYKIHDGDFSDVIKLAAQFV